MRGDTRRSRAPSLLGRHSSRRPRQHGDVIAPAGDVIAGQLAKDLGPGRLLDRQGARRGWAALRRTANQR